VTFRDVSAPERRALCDLLDELGPDAPTVPAGWTTAHLAAHLVVREREPLALPGLVLPAAHGYTARREEARRRGTPYPELVRMLRAGPPLLPMGMPALREAQHTHEFYVHHEDVRRANGGGPRALPPELDRALWRRVRRSAALMLRRARGLAVTLTTPDGRTARGGSGGTPVSVTGPPGELILFVFNRKEQAQVEVSGPAEAVTALRATRLGL
jgi:uncharacterized protein (TIGR03085 family)